MKKFLFIIFAFVIVASCGVGAYSVSSGRADEGAITFTATDSYPIAVIVDNSNYKVKTVKTKAYRTDRKIKQTTQNTIRISPGQHNIKVLTNGQEVYSKTIFVSANEIKIIKL